MQDPDILDYLEQIMDARSIEDVWAIHIETMAGYGFDRLGYGLTRFRSENSLGDPQDRLLLTNHEPDYVHHFIDTGMYYNGTMFRWALENEGACSWRLISERLAQGALAPEELEILEFNRKYDVTAGYTISFKSLSKRAKGGIGLIARRGLSQDDVERIWQHSGRTIEAINNAAHLKIISLPLIGGRRPLTHRQREVLEWVGDGKTTQDIALIMGLTPATVEKHLRLARSTLDVETTAQAVLKASLQNQIFVLNA